MGVTQKKVQVQNLENGMFVSSLDRPWHLTPFPIQGFYIRSEEDIRALASHCCWVTVDVLEARSGSGGGQSRSALFAKRKDPEHQEKTLELPPLQINKPVQYRETSPLKKELKSGAKLLGDIEFARTSIIDSLGRQEFPDLQPLREVCREIAGSVIRNPNAMLWLARIRQQDDHTYRHALNTSIWALVCGRHMGLQEELLNHLAMGCLLAHIGKVDLPESMLANEHCLDAQAFERYKTYVDAGADKLEEAGLPRPVIVTVRGHRERHNGTGFPLGVYGDRIPLLAKIAGLVNYFEALVGPSEGQAAISCAEAVSQLYKARNIAFQADLVEKFIQSIGTYPTGTLVALSSGQRGVVLSQNPQRRLWPRVMVMTDEYGTPLRSGKVINLAEYNDSKSSESILKIDRCLPAGTENLDPQRYDVTGGERRWHLKKLVGA